jgi:hypothetical protein
MQTAPAAEERLINETTSLCRVCKDSIPARVVATAQNEVWMRKRCPKHGTQDLRIGDDAAWYLRTIQLQNPKVPPKRVLKQVTQGCPFDCGACTSHQQKVRLPVLPITSACNLDCPICYTINKNEGAYHMTPEDLAQILAHLKEDHGEIDIINFTGGEPTVHPQFMTFMEMCFAAGVHRTTVSTNGIVLAQNEAMVQRLGEIDARIVLSFDSFDAEADFAMQGAKLVATKHKVLEMLERYDVDTTLIPVVVKGTNDHELGKMVALMLQKPNIRSLELHTMTYTGQGGINFSRAGRMSPHEVLVTIEEVTKGLLRVDDFVPSPCAHPLCYQIAMLLVDPQGGPPVPFTRFMPRETLFDLLGDRLYLEPSAKLEAVLQDAINQLWAEGSEESERILGILKRVLRDLFPEKSISRREAQRRAERAAKAIYLHSHMDEETFDSDRIVQCCVGVPSPDGSNIPTCSYNILYREQDERFNPRPVSHDQAAGGRRKFPA